MSFSKLVALLTASVALTGALAQYSGTAYYYYQNGQVGDCGQVHSDEDFVVALDPSIFNTDMCGNTISVTDNNNGNSISAVIVARCTACDPKNIDLSVGAFESLAGGTGGSIPVTWDFE